MTDLRRIVQTNSDPSHSPHTPLMIRIQAVAAALGEDAGSHSVDLEWYLPELNLHSSLSAHTPVLRGLILSGVRDECHHVSEPITEVKLGPAGV